MPKLSGLAVSKTADHELKYDTSSVSVNPSGVVGPDQSGRRLNTRETSPQSASFFAKVKDIFDDLRGQ
jgi:hypothetical protein